MKRMLPVMLILGFSLFVGAANSQAQWTPIKRLTWNNGTSYFPTIAADSSGNVHVVWSDDTPGNYEIFYGKSTDGGSTWMTTQRITWNNGDSLAPAIAVDSSGNPHVVWYDKTPGNYEIYYRKSTNGGSSWMTTQRISWNIGSTQYPAVAVDSSGSVHVVWYDDMPGNREIYYRKSTNGGSSWVTTQRITWNNGHSLSPDIAVDPSGNPHAVWHDSTPGNYEIFYRKSANGGSTWMTIQRISWNNAYSLCPAIAVDSSGNVHVVWYDSTPGNFTVYFRKSPNWGSTWMTTQRITWDNAFSGYPDIAVDSSGNVHMVWYGDKPGNYEIYYRKSTNGGSTWMASQRITWKDGTSALPDIAVDSSGNVHVVWDDDTTGNREIYYLKCVK